MCFKSESNGSTTPPDYVKDRYPKYLDSVDSLAGQQAPLYAGVRQAGTNPYQQTAQQLMADRALFSDPQTMAARGTLTGISQGGMSNPYLDPGYTEQIVGNNARDMTDSFARGTAAQTNSAAARSGAYGGSAHNELGTVQAGELAKNVGDMAMRTRLGRIDQNAGLFSQDRGAMMQAAGMAPQFSLLDSQAFNDLNQAGNQQQQTMQGMLDTNYDQWKYEQQWPFDMAKFVGDRYAQASGGYGDSSGMQSQNPFGRIIGGLLGI